MLFLKLVEFWPPATRLWFSAQTFKGFCHFKHPFCRGGSQWNTQNHYIHYTYFLKLIIPDIVWLFYTWMQAVRLKTTWRVHFLYTEHTGTLWKCALVQIWLTNSTLKCLKLLYFSKYWHCFEVSPFMLVLWLCELRFTDGLIRKYCTQFQQEDVREWKKGLSFSDIH